MGVTDVEPGQQPGPGVLAVVVGPAAQQPPDPIKRIVTATPMTCEVALDPPAHLIHGGEPQPGRVKGIQHPHCAG